MMLIEVNDLDILTFKLAVLPASKVSRSCIVYAEFKPVASV